MSDNTGRGSIRLDTLPEHPPKDWTLHLVMHLNFGSGKGAASYSIHDGEGRRVEGIGHGYNTREGKRGFFLLGEEDLDYLTWNQLRAAYTAASESRE